MPVAITLPDLGTATARVSLWHVRVGDRVYKGDRLVEVLIPGAVIDIPAPATGLVRERTALPNDTITPGQTLGQIDAERDE